MAKAKTRQTGLKQWVETQIGDGKPYPSNRAFARAAGISEATVRYIRRGLMPGLNALRSMAENLPVSLEFLLSTAGEIELDRDELLEELRQLLERMTPEQRKQIHDLARAMIERRKAQTKTKP